VFRENYGNAVKALLNQEGVVSMPRKRIGERCRELERPRG
jgi:hypothetical protein